VTKLGAARDKTRAPRSQADPRSSRS
jgi:hypothetical protein